MAEHACEKLVDGVFRGDNASIARALDEIEDTRSETLPRQRDLLAALEAHTPEAHTVVGLTGPPGVGKSTLAGALIREWLTGGFGVGMIAVDPTSRRSGGALLGDRVRLGLDPTPRAFVRSMAARERLGGLAPATRAAAVVLRTAFEWTLVETVGVGQSEIDVESVADSVVLVLQPGSGDTLQFMKAGILEIPDVLVVHKCDLGRVAEQTRRDLEAILALQPTGAGRTTGEEPGSWRPPVVSASAQSGLGVAELAHRLEEHRRYLHDSGELARRRERQRRTWVLDLFEQRFGTSGFERLGGRPVAEKLARTLAGPALEVFSQLASRAGFSA